MNASEPGRTQAQRFGEFLRTRRLLAEMSLRDLAARTEVSNAYLSQIERGLHQPSIRILRALAKALDTPPDQLLAQAGLLATVAPAADQTAPPPVEDAIRADPYLSEQEKTALLSVYRTYVDRN